MLMWCMPHAHDGTETQDQKSIRAHVCSVLRRQSGLLTRSETRRNQVAIRPLGCKKTQNAMRQGRSMIPSCCDGEMMNSIGTSQTVHGWTEEYCRYLDFIASVDMSYVATNKERFKVRKQFYARNQRWTTISANDTSRRFSTSSSYAYSHQKCNKDE